MKLKPAHVIGIGSSMVLIGIWQNPIDFLVKQVGVGATVGVGVILLGLLWATHKAEA